MGSWLKLFGATDKMVPFSLGFLKTDIHSHLIPGIDDGSKSMDESIELAKGLYELGYRGAVTTPHIMSDFYRNTPEIIKNGEALLKHHIAQAGLTFNVASAAEYYLDFDFLNLMQTGQLMVFGPNYCLVEFSFIQAPKNAYALFFELQTSGYRPILAHPERYAYWNLNLRQFDELKERGVMFQLNLLSLTGHYGEQVQKTAEMLLQHNMVEWLGTDLHNLHQLSLFKKFSLKASVAQVIGQTSFMNTSLVI